MTQIISSLGEIGASAPTPSGLTPIDLPLLRDGATWNLTGYSDEVIDVWDLRTLEPVATPGAVTIQDVENGVVRWTPDYSAFDSGVYECRIRLSPDNGLTFEPSGVFRFSIGGGPNIPPA